MGIQLFCQTCKTSSTLDPRSVQGAINPLAVSENSKHRDVHKASLRGVISITVAAFIGGPRGPCPILYKTPFDRCNREKCCGACRFQLACASNGQGAPWKRENSSETVLKLHVLFLVLHSATPRAGLTSLTTKGNSTRISCKSPFALVSMGEKELCKRLLWQLITGKGPNAVFGKLGKPIFAFSTPTLIVEAGCHMCDGVSSGFLLVGRPWWAERLLREGVVFLNTPGFLANVRAGFERILWLLLAGCRF
jgi:hypothetical protein